MDPMEAGGSSNGSSSGAAVPPPAPHTITKWSTIKKQLHEPPLPVEEQLQVLWEVHKNETKKKKPAIIPLGSVLRQMKADDDVRRVSDEALQVFSQAGEMFAQELALRAWKHAQDDKRLEIMEKDFTTARADSTIYEFLDSVETDLDTDTETETDSSTTDSEYQWC